MSKPMQNDLQLRKQARAYELWEKAGRPEGRDLDHWLQAEAELNGGTPQAAPAPVKPMAAVAAPAAATPAAAAPATATRKFGLRGKQKA